MESADGKGEKWNGEGHKDISRDRLKKYKWYVSYIRLKDMKIPNNDVSGWKYDKNMYQNSFYVTDT